MRTALTVAGSDSIGGAGIQVDIKAMSVVGIHATSVITAVTAQNTEGVDGIFPMPEEFIKAQLESVLKDCDIKAVKTGMLYSSEIVELVADILEDHEAPLIVDPVMISGTGCKLCEEDFVNTLKKKLLPICELVTPNRYEAETLAGMKVKNEDDVTLACELIGKQGSSVLFKGGHFSGSKVVDYLYLSSEFNKLEYPRLNKAGHGSGCALSAFITANMAHGLDIVNAVMKSRELIQESIATQYAIGHGDVVVNPMVKLKGDTDKFKVLNELDAVANKMVDIVPHEFVPSNGMNLAFALKDAAGPEDVAAINRRMEVHNGMLRKNGPAKFGSAEHLSFIILEIMKHDPEMRCVMNIAFTKDMKDVIEEVGLSSVTIDIEKDNIAQSTISAIEMNKGVVPDAIIDKSGKNRTVRLLAKNPKEMLSKLEEIL